MRIRGLAVLLAVLLSACSGVQQLSDQFEATIESSRLAIALCEGHPQDVAGEGSHSQLAYVIVLAEPPEVRRLEVECHYDVNSYPATLPAPVDPAMDHTTATHRVVVHTVEEGETRVLSEAMGGFRPTTPPGARLIRVSPGEDG